MSSKAFIKRTVLVCLLLFAAAGAQAVDKLKITKSMQPSVAGEGDTVTVCLNINPTGSAAMADIMWVIDISGSMSYGINNIIANINYFTSQLSTQGIDYRNGLYTFVNDGSYDYNTFYGFTPNNSVFASWLSGISTFGGIEKDLEAMVAANNVAGWRPGASKTIILITDEGIPCSEAGGGSLSYYGTAQNLYSQGVIINSISVNTTESGKLSPVNLPPAAGGQWLDYSAPASQWTTFLTTLGSTIGGLSNVVVYDPLPPQLVPVNGSYNDGVLMGNDLVWFFPSVQRGVPQQRCFFAVVTGFTGGTVVNNAYGYADEVSETASNDAVLIWGTPRPTKTTTPTVTPTRTVTPTYTDQFTKSVTATITQTMTYSCTPSITETYSPTQTRTSTASVTGTISITVTGTVTETFTCTFSPTVTESSTNSHTPTESLTNTPSITVTDTASDTPTATVTFSPTVTATITHTATATDTKTVTQTVTGTFTRTVTQTATETATQTDTQTVTQTHTQTLTFTDTATRTVTATITQTASPTSTKTGTQTITETATRTVTATETETVTQTLTSTDTQTHTQTPTVTQTATETATASVTGTVTQTASQTVTQTDTETVTQTDTATVTQTVTRTASQTVTRTMTETNTQTSTPTFTPTITLTATDSFTPTVTRTITQTATPTDTASVTQTATETMTITLTVTATDTQTITQTVTQTATPTVTCTVTQTATPSATRTNTQTVTQSSTATSTQTVTETNTQTSTPSATGTRTATLTITQTATPTATATNTVTVSQTATPSATPSITSTASITLTATGTSTRTITQTHTMTNTATPTVTFTATKTITLTCTRTVTATLTATRTATPTVTKTSTVTPTVTCTSTALPAKIDVIMTALNSTAPQGGEFRINVTVRNNGQSTALGVVIWDSVPAGVSFPQPQAGFTWVPVSGVFTLDAGDIEAGGERNYVFRLRADENGAPDTIVHLDKMTASYNDGYNAALQHAQSNSLTLMYGDITVFPNPFDPAAARNGTLKFANVPDGCGVSIYTISGEFVAQAVLSFPYTEWNAKNRFGAVVSPGIYYYVIRDQGNKCLKTGKIFLRKGGK